MNIVTNEGLPPGDHRSAGGGQQAVGLISVISLGAMIYGLLLWVYVAICGIVVPYTLALPLTHLIPSLREDTSGFIGFAVSFVGFVVHRITTRRPRLPHDFTFA